MKFFITFVVLIIPVTHVLGLENYDSLKSKYKEGKKIRLLVIAGHDNDFSGAGFRDIKESDLNLELAKTIKDYLVGDSKIEVTLSRDSNGYNSEFLKYFDTNKDLIEQDLDQKKSQLNKIIESGSIVLEEEVPHADANKSVAILLYGLNSWIENEKFDLVLHIHHNDYGGRSWNKAGKYSGYSVYIPSPYLLNATTSKYFGNSIGRRIDRTLYKSNQPSEKKYANTYGAIEDFYLIAMGSYNTSSVPRALVEYSYIYEPQIQSQFFTLNANVMGRATVLGIREFLEGGNASTEKNLYYVWENNLSLSKVEDPDVLALQYGLSELGYFPPKNMARDRCPFSGSFGGCTKRALSSFQKANRIPVTGRAGTTTRTVLNKIFEYR